MGGIGKVPQFVLFHLKNKKKTLWWQSCNGIFIDAPARAAVDVRKIVANHVKDIRHSFLEHQRCPASTSDLARIRLHVVFPPGHIGPLDLSLVIADLRRKINTPLVAIAHDNIFIDNGAIPADIQSPEAAWILMGFCKEAAFVSERILTLKTDMSELRWKEKLRDFFYDNPQGCCAGLRWRLSRMGGRMWVSSPSTKPLLDAVSRTDKRIARDDPCIESQISLCGDAGYVGIQILRSLLNDSRMVGSTL